MNVQNYAAVLDQNMNAVVNTASCLATINGLLKDKDPERSVVMSVKELEVLKNNLLDTSKRIVETNHFMHIMREITLAAVASATELIQDQENAINKLESQLSIDKKESQDIPNPPTSEMKSQGIQNSPGVCVEENGCCGVSDCTSYDQKLPLSVFEEMQKENARKERVIERLILERDKAICGHGRSIANVRSFLVEQAKAFEDAIESCDNLDKDLKKQFESSSQYKQYVENQNVVETETVGL